MKSKLAFTIAILVTLVFATDQSFATSGKNKKYKNRSKIQGSQTHNFTGFRLPKWGVAIDASYDPRLDNFVPGYKMLHIVLSNSNDKPIDLDFKRDKWFIRDGAGKKHMAINHLSKIDKDLWEILNPQIKKKLRYPTYVKAGHMTTIDVFFPNKVDLAGFEQIMWHSSHFGKRFDLYTNYENELSLNIPKDEQKSEGDEKQIPIRQTHVKRYNPNDYYKTRNEVLNLNEDGNKQSPDDKSKWKSQDNAEIIRKYKELYPDINFDPTFDGAIPMGN